MAELTMMSAIRGYREAELKLKKIDEELDAANKRYLKLQDDRRKAEAERNQARGRMCDAALLKGGQ